MQIGGSIGLNDGSVARRRIAIGSRIRVGRASVRRELRRTGLDQHDGARPVAGALGLGAIEGQACAIRTGFVEDRGLAATDCPRIRVGMAYQLGDRFKLMLRSETSAPIDPRRVYVFTVDSFGATQLLFGDNIENPFPRLGKMRPPRSIPLTAAEFDLEIGSPAGSDSFFMLASVSPLDNAKTVFNSQGARTREFDFGSSAGAKKRRHARLGERRAGGLVDPAIDAEHGSLEAAEVQVTRCGLHPDVGILVVEQRKQIVAERRVVMDRSGAGGCCPGLRILIG